MLHLKSMLELLASKLSYHSPQPPRALWSQLPPRERVTRHQLKSTFESRPRMRKTIIHSPQLPRTWYGISTLPERSAPRRSCMNASQRGIVRIMISDLPGQHRRNERRSTSKMRIAEITYRSMKKKTRVCFDFGARLLYKNELTTTRITIYEMLTVLIFC